nr:hypothetical protein Iba_chr13aCG9170 [Ipomoea batatas]
MSSQSSTAHQREMRARKGKAPMKEPDTLNRKRKMAARGYKQNNTMEAGDELDEGWQFEKMNDGEHLLRRGQQQRHLTAVTTFSGEGHAAAKVVSGSSAATTLLLKQHATATAEQGNGLRR